MTVIVLTGDCTTTTALALAAGWPTPPVHEGTPTGRETIVVEADSRGGSLSGWLDTPASPSLSTVVTALHQAGGSPGDTRSRPALQWATVDPLIQRSPAGPRFIPAPIRSREARTSVHEAAHGLFPLLADVDTIALVDAGALDLSQPSQAMRFAAVTVICHRQASASAQAAAVRLERLAEQAEALSAAGHRIAIALIGDQPFANEEVVSFAAPHATSWTLPVDQLASAVLAGRQGVSARRLTRLPLMRAAAAMARDLDQVAGQRDPVRSATPDRAVG